MVEFAEKTSACDPAECILAPARCNGKVSTPV
jgi:hypothetical protein